MPTTTLTRRVRFSSAHRYRRPEWSDAKNAEVFGVCARESFHGHNYECEVTVAGSVEPQTGFAVNLAMLDAILRDEVVEPLDHRNLNLDVAEFADGLAVPTSENLAAWVATRVQRKLGTAATVTRVIVREEPNLWATWELT